MYGAIGAAPALVALTGAQGADAVATEGEGAESGERLQDMFQTMYSTYSKDRLAVLIHMSCTG